MQRERPLILHLLPQYGVGGAEIAALSRANKQSPSFDFKLVFMAGKNKSKLPFFVTQLSTSGINSVISYKNAIAYIYSSKPDILICSLWRSMLVGLVVKVLLPKTKIVCFLHSANSAHFVDRIISYIAINLFTETWTDSASTAKMRLSKKSQKNNRILSFLTRNSSPNSFHPKQNNPKFVYWGRRSKVKGIDRALEFFLKVLKIYPKAEFHLWGPTGNIEHDILQTIISKKLQHNVIIHNAISNEKLAIAAKGMSYFLQLSRREGMAMSVAEAMTMGLVPIVTAVGEINTYCIHNENSIIVNPDNMQPSLEALLKALDDDTKYRNLSKKSITYWKYKPSYAEDFDRRISELLISK